MKKYLVLIWLLPLVVGARDVFVTEVVVPYEVIAIDEPVTASQLHLGELENFPIMYEFVLTESTDFRVNITQPNFDNQAPNPLTLLLVRQDDRGGGVTEVARLSTDPNEWLAYKDAGLGVRLLQGGTIERELGVGTYRIEVSTPDNFGKYFLSFGSPDRGGYFSALGEAWQVQQFLGYSSLRILTSSLVYYPLGILFLALLIHRTWKYRKLITNNAT